MRAIIYICFLISTLNGAFAQNYAWLKANGGTGKDESYCVIHDSFGNSYITGIFNDNANFSSTILTSAGGGDAFLAKYNNQGNLLWIQTLGSTGEQGGHMVAVDSNDDVYVTGEFEGTMNAGSNTLTSAGMSDVFLVKYNSSGVFQWSFQGGGTGNDVVNSIDTDASNNIVITGNFEVQAYFGTLNVTSFGSADIYIAKFTSIGSINWLVRAGSILEDNSRGIAVDDNGDICIAGDFQQVATFGSFALNAVNFGHDIFIAKLNGSGVFQWAVKAGGAENDRAYEIEHDESGNYYVCGNFKGVSTFGTFQVNSSGNNDVFVAKLNSSGSFVWVNTGGGSGDDRAYAISYKQGQGVYFTGSFENNAVFGMNNLISSGDHDIFIGYININGITQLMLSAGGPGFDRGYGIASDNVGSVWITGVFNQNAAFGPLSAGSFGSSDMFLLKLEFLVGLESTHFATSGYFYPNPALDRINYNGDYGELEELSVYDIQGHLVYFSEKSGPTLDISFLSKGVYLFRLKNSRRYNEQRIVVH